MELQMDGEPEHERVRYSEDLPYGFFRNLK
jgi:hypothetical protein